MSNPSPEPQDEAKEPTESLEFNKETLQDLEEVELNEADQVKGGVMPRRSRADGE